MLRKFLPRQDNFFLLFQKIADLLVLTANEFNAMMHDLGNQQKYVFNIEIHEANADQLAHNSFHLLHKTFITPFDRHDIHALISGLDDILDQINRCAQRFPYYELHSVPNEITQLSEIILHSSAALKDTVYCLQTLKRADEIFDYCKLIDKAECEAHKLILAGEKSLFQNESDFKLFYKLKEIYSRCKLVIDGIQDVGNIIK